MAASKSRVKRKENPKERQITNCNNPNQYYQCFPSWNFSSCDKEKWSLWEDAVKEIFWAEILPRLQNLESQRWSDIFVQASKQNHSNKVEKLNKKAIDRLEELHIEQDAPNGALFSWESCSLYIGMEFLRLVDFVTIVTILSIQAKTYIMLQVS